MRPMVLVCCIAAAANAQEAEFRAVLPQLGADDYRTREEAERRLEAMVRKGGQGAFDILESRILPGVRAGPDAEVALRVDRVVRRLGTRRLLWWKQLGVALTCAPRIAAGDGVVVRSGPSGLDVLDARTGAVLWSAAGSFEKPLPGIAGGVVYLNRPPDAVAARRAGDGEPLWVHEVADLGGDSGKTHNVYVTRNGSRAKEARPLLPTEWTDRYLTTIHVPEWSRTLVATAGGNIACLGPNGQRIWCVGKSGQWPPPRVAPDLGLVFAEGNEDGQRLLALDAETGKTRWSVPLQGLSWIAGAVSKGTLLVTADPGVDGRIDGRLHAFDARTGALLWTFRPPVPAAYDVPDPHTVGVDPRDGNVVLAIDLMKLDAAEEAPKLLVQRGDLPPAEELGDLSAPVFDGDVCYVTAASGWTIALRIPPFRSRTLK